MGKVAILVETVLGVIHYLIVHSGIGSTVCSTIVSGAAYVAVVVVEVIGLLHVHIVRYIAHGITKLCLADKEAGVFLLLLRSLGSLTVGRRLGCGEAGNNLGERTLVDNGLGVEVYFHNDTAYNIIDLVALGREHYAAL